MFVFCLLVVPSLATPNEWNRLLKKAVTYNVPMTSDEASQDLSVEKIIKEMVGLVGVEGACHVLSQVEELKGCDFPSSLQQFLTDTAALHRKKRLEKLPACNCNSKVLV